MDEGRSVTERTRTATERYAAKISELNELLEAGVIDQQAYARAVEDAGDRALRSSEAWTDGASRFLKDYTWPAAYRLVTAGQLAGTVTKSHY